MARTPKDITETELDVMRVLWADGPRSVRQIAAALYADPAPSQLAAVQTLLARLEGKGCVGRDRSGSVQTFRPLRSRDDLIGQRLQGIAEQLCEGSVAPLLSHLVQRERLSPEDRQALRDLIDRLDSDKSEDEPPPPSGRKSKRQ